MIFLIFALIAVGVFAVPLRYKAHYAAAVIGAGSLYALAAAVCAIAGRTLYGMSEIDGLSALFLIIISLAAFTVTLYSRGYLAHYADKKPAAHFSLHYMALAVMCFSMMSVVCEQSGYMFLFFWELMTISSFVLIMFDAEKASTRRAAINYLVMMHIGFILLVAGFATLDRAGCSVSLSGLAQYFATHSPYALFTLFMLGFGMKAGIFPLHVWLPEAHPAAPSHISAIMSGVMIKTGVYGIIRVISNIHTELYAIGLVLLAVGTVTGLWGAILAALQKDIKRLLAYSSIENIGIIFIGLGGAVYGCATGCGLLALCCMSGALLHTLNHSLFKTALFMGAGNIYSQTHTTSMEALGGLSREMPVTSALFLLGCTAICALPPLNGFISEFLIYAGLFKGVGPTGSALACVGAIAALSLIGGIVMLALGKLYSIVFSGQPRSHAVAEAVEVDTERIVSFALPVAGIVVIGLFPTLAASPIMALAETLLPVKVYIPVHEIGSITDALTKISVVALSLTVLSAVIYALKIRALKKRTVGTSPTWGCGFTSINEKMQYSGESFSEGLQNIASNITADSGGGKAVDRKEIFPTEHAFEISHKDKVDRMFSQWWLSVLKNVNLRVARLSSNKINHYILYALVFLLLVFVFSLLNVL